MPLLKGAASLTRLHWTTTQWDDLLSLLEASFETHAYQANLNKTQEVGPPGWVNPHNLTLPPPVGNQNAWVYNNYMLVSWRQDIRKIPSALFQATLKTRCQDWATEHQRERVPPSIREEIKELVEFDLRAAMSPIPRVGIALFDRGEPGRIWLDGQAERTVKVLAAMLNHIDPEAKLQVDTPVAYPPAWIDEETQALLLNPVEVRPFRADRRDDRLHVQMESLHEPLPSILLPEMMVWIWHRSENGGFDLDTDGTSASLWVDSPIRVSDSMNETMALQTDDLPKAPEAYAALARGLMPTRMHLGLRREEREYVFTLSAEGQIGGLKLPAQVKTGDIAEILYDRMFLLEEFFFCYRMLVRAFLKVRLSPETWATIHRSITRWIDEQSVSTTDTSTLSNDDDTDEDDEE